MNVWPGRGGAQLIGPMTFEGDAKRVLSLGLSQISGRK